MYYFINIKKQIGIKLLFFIVCITACKKDEESAVAPFVDFTITNVAKTHPDTVLFDATSNTDGTVFTWDFKDGTPAQTGNSATHIFDYGFYNVVLRGTANGQTSSKQHGVNASPYTKIYVTTIMATRIPATNSNGDAWDNDGTGPDIYFKILIPNYERTTSIYTDATAGNVSIPFALSPAMIINSIDNYIKIEMYDYDASALSDELIETITIAEGVTSLMTNTLPYQTSITFSGSSSTSAINFSWLN